MMNVSVTPIVNMAFNHRINRNPKRTHVPSYVYRKYRNNRRACVSKRLSLSRGRAIYPKNKLPWG